MVPDDDDAADDDDTVPDAAFIDETYCLDWDVTNITQPSNFLSVLNGVGINLEDWPILLTPTASTSTEIWMMSGTALQGTCTQNTTVQTTDLTQVDPGTFTDPYFAIGPVTATLAAGFLSTTVHDTVITGTFSSDYQTITDGTLDGFVDVSALPFACSLLTCVPCPSTGTDCVQLSAEDAVYNATGAGPLVPVP